MVSERLAQVFREIFSDDDLVVTDATTADEVPGWDSLAHINLIYAVESEFDVSIPDELLSSFANVGELRACIEELCGVR